MQTNLPRDCALRRHTSIFLAVVLLSALGPVRAAPAAPAADLTLCLGRTAQLDWDVFVPQYSAQADILLVVDTTGDMGAVPPALQNSFLTVIVPGVMSHFADPQWGVAEFKDYAVYLNTDPPFPYSLVQGLTSDIGDVQTALNSLTTVGGGDSPEANTRALYESYSDPAIQWRPGARHFVVMYGATLPHEPDPGPDGIPGTADDLTIGTVLAAMRAQDITLLFVGIDDTTIATWQAWAGQTGAGGDARLIPLTGVGLPEATVELLLAAGPEINEFALQADPPEYQSWLATTPISYTNLVIPEGGITLTFAITITLPVTATMGQDHIFDILAVGDEVVFGTQHETIHPRGCAYAPLCQFSGQTGKARPGP